MPRVHVSIPLKAQLGVVLALFVAALLTLWSTSMSAIEREGRRASAKGLLERAGLALAAEGRSILDQSSPLSPFEYVDPEYRRELDRRLREVAGNVLRPMRGVEGGYFLSDSKQFVGSSRPMGPAEPKKAGDRAEPVPPLPEADLI
ncbi:two-component system sensor histidine kinase NtrB, partial [Singulisphaera rosea]